MNSQRKRGKIIVHCAVYEECTNNNRIFNKIKNYDPLSKQSILPVTSSRQTAPQHYHACDYKQKLYESDAKYYKSNKFKKKINISLQINKVAYA